MGKASAKKSPSRRKYGHNGKTKVVRIRQRCLCGELFSVLLVARHNDRALCPRCKLMFAFSANARLDSFTVELVRREIRQEVRT